MTEKRFQDIGGYITDTDSYCCTKVYEKTSDIVDLLNQYSEENDQLKEIFKTMIKQLEIEIDSEETIYQGTFVFNSESFMILKKLCK